jgi:beta-lactamase superfamily II metal-dependent hydrolase
VALHYAVISAEKNGHGIFPAPEIVKRYQAIGSQVFNTAKYGSIFFSTNGINLFEKH